MVVVAMVTMEKRIEVDSTRVEKFWLLANEIGVIWMADVEDENGIPDTTRRPRSLTVAAVAATAAPGPPLITMAPAGVTRWTVGSPINRQPEKILGMALLSGLRIGTVVVVVEEEEEE